MIKNPVLHRPCENGLRDRGAAGWSSRYSECSDFQLSQTILHKRQTLQLKKKEEKKKSTLHQWFPTLILEYAPTLHIVDVSLI